MPSSGLPFPSESPAARTLRRGFGRLRFEPALEAEFWSAHNASTRARVRLNVFLALTTTLSFALLDHWLLGQAWKLPEDLIRFGVQLPIIVLCLLLTSAGRYETRYLPAINLGAPLFGIGSVIMATGAPEPQVALLSTLVLAEPPSGRQRPTRWCGHRRSRACRSVLGSPGASLVRFA